MEGWRREFIGKRSLHVQKHTCASCGYPAAKTRKCMFSPFLELIYPTVEEAADNELKDMYWHDGNRQLEREGQEKKDHRFRTHSLPQDCRPQVCQRFPKWSTKGFPGTKCCTKSRVNVIDGAFLRCLIWAGTLGFGCDVKMADEIGRATATIVNTNNYNWKLSLWRDLAWYGLALGQW